MMLLLLFVLAFWHSIKPTRAQNVSAEFYYLVSPAFFGALEVDPFVYNPLNTVNFDDYNSLDYYRSPGHVVYPFAGTPNGSDVNTYGRTLLQQNGCGLLLYVKPCSGTLQVWLNITDEFNRFNVSGTGTQNFTHIHCDVYTQSGGLGIIPLTSNVNAIFRKSTDTMSLYRVDIGPVNVTHPTAFSGVYGFEIGITNHAPFAGNYISCLLQRALGGVSYPLFSPRAAYCQSNYSGFANQTTPNSTLTTHAGVSVLRSPLLFTDPAVPAIRRANLFASPVCASVTMCTNNQVYVEATYTYSVGAYGLAYVFPVPQYHRREPLFIFSVGLGSPQALALLKNTTFQGSSAFHIVLSISTTGGTGNGPFTDFVMVRMEVIIQGTEYSPAYCTQCNYIGSTMQTGDTEIIGDYLVDSDYRYDPYYSQPLAHTHFTVTYDLTSCLRYMEQSIPSGDAKFANASFIFAGVYKEFNDYAGAPPTPEQAIFFYGFELQYFEDSGSPNATRVVTYIGDNTCEPSPPTHYTCETPSESPTPVVSQSPTNSMSPTESDCQCSRYYDMPYVQPQCSGFGKRRATSPPNLLDFPGHITICDPRESPEKLLAGGIYKLRDHITTSPESAYEGYRHLGLQIGGLWLSFSTRSGSVKMEFMPGKGYVIISGIAQGYLLQNETFSCPPGAGSGFAAFHCCAYTTKPRQYMFKMQYTDGLNFNYNPTTPLLVRRPGDYTNDYATDYVNYGYIYDVDDPTYVINISSRHMISPLYNDAVSSMVDFFGPAEFMIQEQGPYIPEYPWPHIGPVPTLTGIGALWVDCSQYDLSRINLATVVCSPLVGISSLRSSNPYKGGQYGNEGIGFFMFEIDKPCNDCAPTPSGVICPVHHINDGHGADYSWDKDFPVPPPDQGSMGIFPTLCNLPDTYPSIVNNNYFPGILDIQSVPPYASNDPAISFYTYTCGQEDYSQYGLQNGYENNNCGVEEGFTQYRVLFDWNNVPYTGTKRLTSVRFYVPPMKSLRYIYLQALWFSFPNDISHDWIAVTNDGQECLDDVLNFEGFDPQFNRESSCMVPFSDQGGWLNISIGDTTGHLQDKISLIGLNMTFFDYCDEVCCNDVVRFSLGSYAAAEDRTPGATPVLGTNNYSVVAWMEWLKNSLAYYFRV